MSTTIRILFLGDIVGEPGRKAVQQLLPEIKRKENIDFTIVNGENSAAGRGITPKIAIDLLRAGATDAQLADFFRDVVDRKPKEHDFRDGYQPQRHMTAIGG